MTVKNVQDLLLFLEVKQESLLNEKKAGVVFAKLLKTILL